MQVVFIGSFPTWDKMPEGRLPEFAFVGRSNVGKSSLINMLAGRSQLAHTSSVPGKTQMINVYEVNGMYRIVDLPGYGYARLSKKHRSSLIRMIKDYLLHRQALFLVFQLLDLRVDPQEADMSMLRWVGENGIPVRLIFTKIDKLKAVDVERHRSLYTERLHQDWETLPEVFETSAIRGEGREEVLGYIADCLSNA